MIGNVNEDKVMQQFSMHKQAPYINVLHSLLIS